VKITTIDSMKDNLISHTIKKMIGKKKIEALVDLFQNSCSSQ